MSADKPKKKKIMLALQGGGAHTAYVWGVVDRLLDNEEIEIVAVSGTSGGAIIAAVLAYGLSVEKDVRQRRARAKELLSKFWRMVGEIGDSSLNPYRFVPNMLHPSWNIDGMPVPVALNALSLLTSPYQSWLSPRQNPVAAAIEQCINFDELNSSKSGPALYVCATNVRTGQPKMFPKEEIRTPHLLASACLPVVDRAIQIGKEYYWDGGYVADPALAPMIERHRDEACDLVIVGVNPIVRPRTDMPPDTAWEIIDRMNEITFNASLIAEIKRIDATNRLLEQIPADAPAKKQGGQLHRKKSILMHYIPPHAEMAGYGVASKSNTAWPFLSHLHTLGHKVARLWEEGRTPGGGAALLGKSSDTNLADLFIDPQRPDAAPLPEKVQGVHTNGEGAATESAVSVQ